MPSSADRVVLRAWRPADLAAATSVADDPFLRRWSTLPDDPAAWLAAQGPHSHAITAPPDDTALGKVALRPRDDEISFWIVPAARGRGLAAAAVRALLRASPPGVYRLDVDADNPASEAVAVGLGARPGREHVETDRGGVARPLRYHLLSVG